MLLLRNTENIDLYPQVSKYTTEEIALQGYEVGETCEEFMKIIK